MGCHRVYLEIANDGLCMAHVMDLPGCAVRDEGREEALRRLPDAIRDYYAWLSAHGEPIPAHEASVEIEVAGESTGFGPFDPGNAAALFPPDCETVHTEEMKDHFRKMAYARADLLALVHDLPDEILDWQPDPQRFALRRVLRHIGNAEKWYVSRLVPPETLPPEWEHDEDMPLLNYLEMSRRTAIARLRQLSTEERAAVVYPTIWTQHPEEPWTLRKALRRFLEHEREHIGQVREILAAWRNRLLAHLATERAGLLWQLVGLDETTLTILPVFADWTAKDLLAHVAAWDETHRERMEKILAGREKELSAVDLDARNAALYAERKDWPLERAVEAFTGARAAYLQVLAGVSDEELHRLRSTPSGQVTLRRFAERRAWHDAMHAKDLIAWRERQDLRGGPTGPKSVLLAALAGAREELLAAAALVPVSERASRQVCGEWTLKDVLGHVADWEWVCVSALQDMAAGREPRIEGVDMEAWNWAHVQARSAEPWEAVWADLHAVRSALLEVLQGMEQQALARPVPNPWDAQGTPYRWVCFFPAHDRHHASDVRKAINGWGNN